MQGASPSDAADLCAGVRAAIDFLAERGLREPLAAFVIEATTRLPQEVGCTAAGRVLAD